MVIVMGEIGICLKGEEGQFLSLLLGTVQIRCQSGSVIRTLDRTLVLNAGTVHRGTLLLDFPIFALLHAFFGNFFFKIEIYNLDLG
jgi:hypothetical protein